MKNPSHKKKEEKRTIKIKEIASFTCGVYQNAVNISIALAQAGRFVNIINGSSGYIVFIYERA